MGREAEGGMLSVAERVCAAWVEGPGPATAEGMPELSEVGTEDEVVGVFSVGASVKTLSGLREFARPLSSAKFGKKGAITTRLASLMGDDDG